MATKSKEIFIPAIQIGKLIIDVEGDTSLICHKWSEKAKKQIKDKQAKKAKAAKEARDPEAEYIASLYQHPEGGFGFPAIGFKKAMVGACRYADAIPMTVARGGFFVEGELIKINGTPEMREDMVRIGMGTSDIRYRGEFKSWSATIEISYNESILSPEQIVNLLNIAGFAVGVGEHRPEKDGPYGRFHVVGG